MHHDLHLMNKRETGRLMRRLFGIAPCAVLIALLGMALAGCQAQTPEPPKKKPYVNLGIRPALPPCLRDTIFERTDLANTGPLPVTTFGLAVNLRYAGDSRAPVPVREWMIKEMYRHGFGQKTNPQWKDLTPEQVLSDKRAAIVMVGAYVPPGARKGQRTDIIVQALPGSDTSSLVGGNLYQCELRIMGANPINPGGSVNNYVEARGPLFINPAYALEVPKPMEGEVRTGSRVATILGGGVVSADRAIHLRVRTPQYSISRAMEAVINQRFQADADKPRIDGRGMCVAEAQDEGYIHLYVPHKYEQNWEHFVAIVNHLYINLTPSAAAQRARELVAEAKRPGAPLRDISFAFEGLGPVASPYIAELLMHPVPEVAFAAAKAGTYLQDPASEDALMRMAQMPGHPFRIDAIQVLGDLPQNPAIARALSPCLDDSETQVRIEAYKALCHIDDPRIPTPILSKKINDSFILDVVETTGKPMIYATRAGEPRLAIFGSRQMLKMPLTFSAFDTRLTISQNPNKPQFLTVFYRGEELQEPIAALTRPLVVELAARLGGGSDDRFRFGYGEVVAMLQSMADTGKVSSTFVLQDLPGLEEAFGDVADASTGRDVGQPATSGGAPGNPVGVNARAPAGNGVPPARPN